MSFSHPDYKVEGYGDVKPEYDGPYLAGADFDPRLDFAKAGDPEASAENNKKRDALKAKRRAKFKDAARRRKAESETAETAEPAETPEPVTDDKAAKTDITVSKNAQKPETP